MSYEHKQAVNSQGYTSILNFEETFRYKSLHQAMVANFSKYL